MGEGTFTVASKHHCHCKSPVFCGRWDHLCLYRLNISLADQQMWLFAEEATDNNEKPRKNPSQKLQEDILPHQHRSGRAYEDAGKS